MSTEWTPIDLRKWPNTEDDGWKRTKAARQQRYGEWRIEDAQESEDVKWEEGAQ